MTIAIANTNSLNLELNYPKLICLYPLKSLKKVNTTPLEPYHFTLHTMAAPAVRAVRNTQLSERQSH